ncbi:titin isoform X2 [Drosophila willistoni]|uniref:titin isoform X2 n=1 Tax=Drosophila willistoni TaxID=7260 RepID=UPI000C26C206|nr:titin isoform X2 [Drosophila willistoni]
MVLDIKMCRFDNVPWGFRLVGGSDYEYPLTVVKVTENSIADEAGLRVEDVVVRINDTAATPLTHDEAHRLIMNSGSVFYFGVYRENEENEQDAKECLKKFPVSESSLTKSPTPPTEAINAPTTEPEPKPVPVPGPVGPALDECLRVMSEVHSEDNGKDVDEDVDVDVEVEAPTLTGPGAVVGAETGALYLPDLPDRPCSALSEHAEIKLVEEEIAAVLSGETEVLKEHNVLGVNFYRIFPKPGVCMSSDVLRSLNEEVTKTKLEKDKENRKWSTFLQRPNRPVPKSKQQLEAERRAANAYKVTIVKSVPRDKSPMPEVKPTPTPKEATPSPPKESTPPGQPVENVDEEVVEEPLPTDSEVPNLEQLPENGQNGENNDEEQLEKADVQKDVLEDTTEPEPAIATETPTELPVEGDVAVSVEAEAIEDIESTPPSPSTITPPKTDEELALEKQLADVQKQLAALSSLPSTIQSTLDAVTKQLADLLPTFKLQQQKEQPSPQIDEEGQGENSAPGMLSENAAEADKPAGPCENNEDKCDANDLEVAEISRSNGDNRQAAEDKESAQLEHQQQELSEEQSFKKQKKHDVIEELEEHLVRNKNPKRSKRAFGPLVPSSERPLVLPGGRRWYRPKDAYNDEFIAETLSAQAELITGTTLGVNFMKYQKPERKIDLNRSEVYKYLNPHLDRAPVRGIEVRAPMVAAESDIRQSLQS